MEIEKQVVSLELAKRLKKLGVKQESYFYWCNIGCEALLSKWAIRDFKESGQKVSRLAAAFTVAELGEMLPAGMCGREWYKKPPHGVEVGLDFSITPRWGKGTKRYLLHMGADEHYVTDNKEADARAKILIYRLEKKKPPPSRKRTQRRNSV